MGSVGQLLGGVVGGIGGFILGGPAGAVTGFSFGYTIGGLVFGLDLPSPTRATDEFSVTAATEGTSPDVVFGRRRVDGNVIYFGPVDVVEVTDGGKGSAGAVTELRPFAPVHLTLAVGGSLREFVGVTDAKGRDWEELNLSVGGSALQVSHGLGTDFAYAPESSPLRGIVTVYSPRLFMGENARSMTPLRFVLDISPVDALGDPYSGMSTGCNAASVLWTVLSEKQVFRGIPITSLNRASFDYGYEVLKAENRGVNVREANPESTSVEQFVEKLLFHVNGILRTADDGSLEMFLIRNDYVPLPIHAREMQDVQMLPGVWLGVKNIIQASFPDAGKDFDQSSAPPRINAAAIALTGYVNVAQYDFPYYTDVDNVVRRMLELEDEISYPPVVASFRTSKRYHKVRKGDVFAITHPAFGLVDAEFRVFEVEDADYGKEGMLFKCRLVRKQLMIDYTPPFPEPESPAPAAVPVDPVGVTMLAIHWPFPQSPPPGGGGGGNGYPGNPPPPPSTGSPTFAVGSPDYISPPYLEETYWGFPFFYWAARGAGRDVAYLLAAAVAKSAELPAALPASDASYRWGFAFVTASRVEADDFRICLAGSELLLALIGYSGQVVDLPDNSASDPNGFWPDAESGRYVLVLGNTEVVTFRQLVAQGGGTYKLTGAARCVNKEYPYAWPIGTPAMIVDIRRPPNPFERPWHEWAYRQRQVSAEEYADPSLAARLRVFARSVDLAGSAQPVDAGFGGPNGLTLTDRSGPKTSASGMYLKADEAASGRAPMPACQAVRVGDGFEHALWNTDVSGLLPGDFVVEFPPVPNNDLSGVGDALVFDTVETPGDPFGGPSSGYERFAVAEADKEFDEFCGRPDYYTTYRLYVTADESADPKSTSLRTMDVVVDASTTTWPRFAYTEIMQAADGTVGGDCALWVAVLGRNGHYSRPRLVQMVGPFRRQIDPSLLVEPA